MEREHIASTENLGRAGYCIKQKALFFLVALLLESWNLSNAIEAIRQLKKTFWFACGTLKNRSECAAHWVVSLLFKPSITGSIDIELAQIPPVL